MGSKEGWMRDEGHSIPSYSNPFEGLGAELKMLGKPYPRRVPLTLHPNSPTTLFVFNTGIPVVCTGTYHRSMAVLRNFPENILGWAILFPLFSPSFLIARCTILPPSLLFFIIQYYSKLVTPSILLSCGPILLPSPPFLLQPPSPRAFTLKPCAAVKEGT